MEQNKQTLSNLYKTLESKPSLITLFIIFPLLSLFLAKSTLRRRKPYPPGPKGLPLIGNITMVDQLTHRGLARLAKTYGGLLHLRIGFRHVVAVSSPEIARQVLQVQDNIFSNRPATIAISYLTYDRADMAFAHYGPFWRQMRKICVVKLFSRRRAESWDSVRDEVHGMVRTVARGVGSNVDVGELVFGLTRNIIYRAAFGSSSREGQDEFVGILQEFSKLFGAFNVADFLPFLGWLDPQGLNRRLVRARASLDGFIDSIIDEHMEKKMKKIDGLINDKDDSDMVDELLAFFSDGECNNVENESEDLQNSIKLTRDNIKAIIMDVMFGGTETVASAIEWAMAELLHSPKHLKWAQEELAKVVGLAQKLDEAHFEKLTFLKACLKETLRLHPPIPLLLHETAENAVVSGYRIPAKSRVIINAWAIGRDPSAWEDPDRFAPERFLKEGDGGGDGYVPDFKGSCFEFIPFGSGRRSCPGMSLGLHALELAVGNLLHCFEWELPSGVKASEMDMGDVFGLTAPRAERLAAVPKKRLAIDI